MPRRLLSAVATLVMLLAILSAAGSCWWSGTCVLAAEMTQLRPPDRRQRR